MNPPRNQSGAYLLTSMTKVKSLTEPSRQFGAHYKRLEFLIEHELPLSQVTGCGPSISVGTDAYANI